MTVGMEKAPPFREESPRFAAEPDGPGRGSFSSFHILFFGF